MLAVPCELLDFVDSSVRVVVDQCGDERAQGVGPVPVLVLDAQGFVGGAEPGKGGRSPSTGSSITGRPSGR